MFTLTHFLWLGASVIVVALAIYLLKRFNVSSIHVGWAVIVIGLVAKIIHFGLSMIAAEDGGMILDQNEMDFHLCSMLIYVILAANMIKNKKVVDVLKGFIAPAAAIGATMALLIPADGVSPSDPRVWRFMIYHVILVFYGFYLMLVEKVDLALKTYKRNLFLLVAFAFFAFNMNSILAAYDTNYLYLRKPPVDNLPVLNLDNGYGVYLITIVGIALLLLTLVHLPFMIKRKKAVDDQKMSETHDEASKNE